MAPPGEMAAGHVTSLRQLAGELTTGIAMLTEAIAGLPAGHRGYRTIQALPGTGPVLAAVIAAEIGDISPFACTWQDHYPAIVKLWRAHWSSSPRSWRSRPRSGGWCIRRTMESMNARLRKVTRNRGQFPSKQAALKVLYLAVRNLEEFRSPNTGIRSSAWKQALQAFTINFDGRIPTP